VLLMARWLVSFSTVVTPSGGTDGHHTTLLPATTAAMVAAAAHRRSVAMWARRRSRVATSVSMSVHSVSDTVSWWSASCCFSLLAHSSCVIIALVALNIA
jgi:hypothetical protein